MTHNLSSVKASGFDINILDELGLNREEAVFKSRTQALTNPTQYAADREAMFGAMKVEVSKSYAETKGALTG